MCILNFHLYAYWLALPLHYKHCKKISISEHMEHAQYVGASGNKDRNEFQEQYITVFKIWLYISLFIKQFETSEKHWIKPCNTALISTCEGYFETWFSLKIISEQKIWNTNYHYVTIKAGYVCHVQDHLFQTNYW